MLGGAAEEEDISTDMAAFLGPARPGIGGAASQGVWEQPPVSDGRPVLGAGLN